MHRCYDEMHTHNLNINSCFNLPSRRLESRLSTRPRMRSTLCGIISPSLTFSITIFIFRHLICDAVLWEATDYTPTSFFSAAWCLREAKREVDNNSVEKDDSDDVDLQNEAKTKRYNYQISFFSHEDKLGELSRGKGATFGETFVALLLQATAFSLLFCKVQTY